jgi:hypothetical protein
MNELISDLMFRIERMVARVVPPGYTIKEIMVELSEAMGDKYL